MSQLGQCFFILTTRLKSVLGFSTKKDTPFARERFNGFGLYEIIYTTARNRYPRYIELGLGYDIIETIANEVWERCRKFDMRQNDKNIIDQVEILFEEAEARQIARSKLMALEYGM